MNSYIASFLFFAVFTQTACDPPRPELRAEIIHIDEFAPPEFVPPPAKSNPSVKPEAPEEPEREPPTEDNPLDLNAATAAELELLPGVGPSTAAAILKYREKRLFEQKRHLKRVPGIGPKTYERLAPLLAIKLPGETDGNPDQEEPEADSDTPQTP